MFAYASTMIGGPTTGAISAATVFARATAANRSLSPRACAFQLRSKLATRQTSLEGQILYSGASLTYRVIDRSGLYSDTRIYRVAGQQVTAYDVNSDETIHRTGPVSQSLPGRIAFVFGRVPDPVSATAGPTWVAKFLARLGNPAKFKCSSVGKDWVVSSGGSAARSFRLRFDQRFHLVGVETAEGKDRFTWHLGPLSHSAALSIPAGGRSVSAFHPHRPLPTFADERARDVALGVLRAARKLKPCEILVKRPEGETALFWNHGMVRQVGGSSSWAYDGNRLSLIVGHSFYRGKASHADALDYLAFLAKGEEPLSRSFLLQSNPFDEFFDPNSVVQIKGTMVDRGVASTILEIKGRTTRSSLIVKNSSFSVENASTDTLSASGQVLQHDEASFRYLPLPKSNHLFELAPPKYTKLEKLPKNAIKVGRFANYRTYEINHRNGM